MSIPLEAYHWLIRQLSISPISSLLRQITDSILNPDGVERNEQFNRNVKHRLLLCGIASLIDETTPTQVMYAPVYLTDGRKWLDTSAANVLRETAEANRYDKKDKNWAAANKFLYIGKFQLVEIGR